MPKFYGDSYDMCKISEVYVCIQYF